MELFFAPLACSMSARIALAEAGAAINLVEVDTKAGRLLRPATTIAPSIRWATCRR